MWSSRCSSSLLRLAHLARLIVPSPLTPPGQQLPAEAVQQAFPLPRSPAGLGRPAGERRMAPVGGVPQTHLLLGGVPVPCHAWPLFQASVARCPVPGGPPV